MKIRKNGTWNKKHIGTKVVSIALAFLFVFSTLSPLTAKAASTSNVTFVKGRKITYGNWSTNYFTINENTAYCLEPSKPTPETGEKLAEVKEDNTSLLTKGLYYLYGGPGFTDSVRNQIFQSVGTEDEMYCYTHAILSFIFDNCDATGDAFKGLNEGEKQGVIDITNWLNTMPSAPNTSISFSSTKEDTYYDATLDMQRTKVITFLSDGRNTVTIPLDEGITLVNVTKNTEVTRSAILTGGDQFYLKAPVAYNNGGTYSSGDLQGSDTQQWRALIIASQGGTQTIGGGSYLYDPTEPASFSVDWLKQPEINLTKIVNVSDAKKTEGFQQGDLVPFKLDVTNVVERSVGTNLVISDTITTPTEGLKLQKSSIVLLDQDKNVIDDCKITVKGNSFTIATGDSLKYTQSLQETGQSWSVEYEALITDISKVLLAEKIVNDARATFENAPEGKAEVVVYPRTPSVSIGTQAIDKETNSKQAIADSSVTIVDTVSYQNLIVGKEYLLKGWEMVKDADGKGTELIVNGKKVANELKFTPTSANGEIVIEFTFDASALAGKSVVTYEELYDNTNPDQPTIVAEHKDITNTDQTVAIVKISIGTKAMDKETKSKQAYADNSVTIVDTVSYQNLIVGKEYLLKGWEMVKGTDGKGTELIVNGKKVANEVKFTPTTTNGELSLEFTFDASALAGKSVVTYEELYDNTNPDQPVLVAEHKDITNTNQTVGMIKVPVTPTTVQNVQTGDHASIGVIGMIVFGVIGCALSFLLFFTSRKKQRR